MVFCLDGGTVTTPDGELVVPGGSKVDPDGTITDSNGTKLYPTEQGGDGQDTTPVGYFKVTYKPGESDVEGQKDVVQLVKQDSKPTVMGNPFKTNDKTFIGWDTADVGDEIKSNLVLTAQWKATGSVILAWAENEKVQKGVKDGEYKLVMRGEWATTDSDDSEKTYTIPVLVDGKLSDGSDLRWYVDAASYKDKFGFKGRLTGDDIVNVDAQTGEITVKNSGIVRIYCESKTNPAIRISVVVIVPGDVTKDGSVQTNDLTWVLNATDEPDMLKTDVKDPRTWYLLELADVTGDGRVQTNDITAILEITDGDKLI